MNLSCQLFLLFSAIFSNISFSTEDQNNTHDLIQSSRKSIKLKANENYYYGEIKMKNIFVPTNCTCDWKNLLAEPDKQWKTGYSARTLAHSWEDVEGFPKEIEKVIKSNSIFSDIYPLLIFPEFKVYFPPKGAHPSQNDIWILAKTSDKIVSITVEGKVNEDFGAPLSEWLKKPSKGKLERIDFIETKLKNKFPNHIRYQLLHRTLSALLQAEKYHAKYAIMLIHSFSDQYKHFEDYVNFLKVYNKQGQKDQIISIGTLNNIDVYVGWVKGDLKYLDK